MQITISRRGVLLATVLVAVGAGAGMGWAAIPSSDGTISACLKKDGNIKVIDVEGADDCKKHDQLLQWNVQGPQGIRGEQGPQGEQGLQGPQGSPGPAATKPAYFKTGSSLPIVPLAAGDEEKTILTLDVPAGSYAITGSFKMLASTIAPAPAALVFCGVYGGTGTSNSPQASVGQIGGASSEVMMPLVAARTLSAAGRLTMSCIARPLNVAVSPTQTLVNVQGTILAQATDPLSIEEPVGA